MLGLRLSAALRLRLLVAPSATSFWSAGEDSIRLLLIYLSIWLIPLMNIANRGAKTERGLFIITKGLLIALILRFSVTGILSFYFMFEFRLIPIFVILMGWGYQPERLKARLFIVFYTLVSSLPLLVVIMIIGAESGRLMFDQVFSRPRVPFLIRLFLSAGFLVKLPIFGVHLWLPRAHVEAPVSGRIVLAGVMLKLGGYGLFRFSVFYGVDSLSLFVSAAMLGGGILGAICCRCIDAKVLIAYSSVVHIAIVCLVLIRGSKLGFEGALWTMVAHGLTSSGIFAGANIIYERRHSRRLSLNKGVLNFMPRLSIIWFLLMVLNFAGPFTLNLYAEMIIICSCISLGLIIFVPVRLLSFFSAAYSLRLYTSTHQGGRRGAAVGLRGLSLREASLLWSHVWPCLALLLSLPSW